MNVSHIRVCVPGCRNGVQSWTHAAKAKMVLPIHRRSPAPSQPGSSPRSEEAVPIREHRAEEEDGHAYHVNIGVLAQAEAAGRRWGGRHRPAVEELHLHGRRALTI